MMMMRLIAASRACVLLVVLAVCPPSAFGGQWDCAPHPSHEPMLPATAGVLYQENFTVNAPGATIGSAFPSLPAGFTFVSAGRTGTLSVKVNAPGTYYFALSTYLHLSCPLNEYWFSLVVQSGPPGTVCEPTADPLNLTVGVPFTQQWHAYDRPYDSYTAATFSADTTPDGLTFSSDGMLSGTPKAPGPHLLHVVAKSSTTACQMEDWVQLNVNAPAAFNRLFWQHASNGMLAVWNMSDRSDEPPMRMISSAYLNPYQVADLTWRVVGIADFNADGQSDILWRNVESGLLAVWLMNGITLASSIYLTPATAGDLDWHVAAVVDVNGDRKPDIIWRHASSGFLAAWIMDGTTMRSSVYLMPYQEGDLGWRIRGAR